MTHRWIACWLICCSGVFAQTKITGIAEAGFFAKDLAAARVFYGGLLGYPEPKPGMFQVNAHQRIVVLPEREAGSDRLSHIAFAASKRQSMKDPEGHRIEMVKVKEQRTRAASPVSSRLLHVGILVGESAPSLRFYKDELRFVETWRGGRDPKALSWINLRVPDGTEYIEFMLYRDLPAPDKRGVQHHICLEVPDMDKAVALLETRRGGYPRPFEIKAGVNRRRQCNLYDPNGTRVELMEPRTVDGAPAPWSDAPPPR